MEHGSKTNLKTLTVLRDFKKHIKNLKPTTAAVSCVCDHIAILVLLYLNLIFLVFIN